MHRYLEDAIRADLTTKIVILSGPRQVGKTTLSRQLTSSFVYLNYDSAADRKVIRSGELSRNTEWVIFDELHKMKNWKAWIKGTYDTDAIVHPISTGAVRARFEGENKEKRNGHMIY